MTFGFVIRKHGVNLKLNAFETLICDNGKLFARETGKISICILETTTNHCCILGNNLLRLLLEYEI